MSCACWSTRSDFAVTSELAGEQLVLRLFGELDLATASVLEHHIDTVWSNDPPALVLDLKELTFMDCRGVRLILQTQQRAIAAAKFFSLREVPRQVQRVFDLLGLAEQVPIDAAPIGELEADHECPRSAPIRGRREGRVPPEAKPMVMVPPRRNI